MPHAATETLALDPQDPRTLDDEERLRRFGAVIDAIKTRVEAQIGAEDVAHVRRLDALSRGLEVGGRLLIHFSFEPFSFGLGVVALAIHKTLQASEIGHAALHGAYDNLPGAERFRSKTYAWDAPIDEESWRYGHNIRHHQYTNIAGKDGDIHFGGVRLTEHTPHRKGDRLRTLVTLALSLPNFAVVMNAHFTGLVDLYLGNGLGSSGGEPAGAGDGLDFLPDRSWKSVFHAHWRAYRKYVPYFAKNYVLFPLLAGPFWAKVLFGNWLAETLRDLYLSAVIYCGHVGEDVAAYPVGSRAHGRGCWYAMQVEASNNFEVGYLTSVLCGGLDHQIEHHLFPRFPPERLRQVAPEIRAACEAHGVTYRTDTWPRTLRKAFGYVLALSRGEGAGADRRGGSAGAPPELEHAA